MSRPRIRSIKPEMWQDESFGSISRDARLLFIGLITMADDEGRLRAMPSAITGHVFPYDGFKPAKLKALLHELARVGLILRYENAGVPYVSLPGWAKHQKINKPSPSTLPAPGDPGLLRELSGSATGVGTDRSEPHAGARVGADRIGSDLTTPLTPQGGNGESFDAARERLQLVAPSKPAGNRKTEQADWRAQFGEWAAEHFPGCQPTAIEGLATWVRSRGVEPTPDALRQFAADAPNFAHVLEPAA